YRSTDQARPAPCSPLPGTVRDSFRAPRDPNDGRRTGRGGLIGDSRRAAGAHGNAVAGAAGRSRDEVAAYLALAQVPGIGAARLRTLVPAFETAAAALRAPHGARAALPGVSRAAATAIRAGSPQAGHEILDQLDRRAAAVLLPEDAASPPPLRERMVAHGCLVTELPPGERPHAGAFPRRNRLISGLAGVTVVIEAAPGSGALITADCALDQGRAVLAVPGPITSPTSLGCNKLIQQGAKPALAPGDILEELGIESGAWDSGLGTREHNPDARTPSPVSPRVQPPDLSDLQRSLWDAMAAEPKHVDVLVSSAGTDTSAVLTALTELELRGV